MCRLDGLAGEFPCLDAQACSAGQGTSRPSDGCPTNTQCCVPKTLSECRVDGLAGLCDVSLEACSAGQGTLRASVDCPGNTQCCVWNPVSVERPPVSGIVSQACVNGKRIFKVNVNVTGAGGLTNTRSIPIEMVFALDSSGSMAVNDPQNRRQAASIEVIDGNLNATLDFAGVVSWDNDIDFFVPLTNDFTVANTGINNVDADGLTNLDVGIQKAIEILQASTLPVSRRAILFLTDGVGTYTNCSANGSPAKDAANKGIKIYSVGLGNSVSTSELQDIATCTNAKYIPSPSAADLSAVFADLFNAILASTAPLNVTASFTLMSGITYVQGSANPPPTTISTTIDGRTKLEWENIDGSKGLSAGTVYPISFDVTATSSGQVVDQLTSGVTFKDPEGRSGKVLLSSLLINLGPPDPCKT